MFASGVAAAVVLVALVPSDHAPVERMPGPPRDAGAATQAGRADFVIWRVTCGSGRAYFVEVHAAGELAVEALYYGDPIGPAGPSRQAPETDRRLVPWPEGP